MMLLGTLGEIIGMPSVSGLEISYKYLIITSENLYYNIKMLLKQLDLLISCELYLIMQITPKVLFATINKLLSLSINIFSTPSKEFFYIYFADKVDSIHSNTLSVGNVVIDAVNPYYCLNTFELISLAQLKDMIMHLGRLPHFMMFFPCDCLKIV